MPKFQAGGTTVNTFQVGNGTVKNIRSQVTLSGSMANPQANTLLVDDSKSTTQDKVSEGMNSLGAGLLDQFFGSGGRLSYSGMSALTLNLSNAYDDTMAVSPDPVTTFTVNGSPKAFQAGHGALLNFNQVGQTNPVNHAATPGSGYWTFDKPYNPVNYSNMGVSLSP
jgi:hypothetical protein